jgi:hypothetical protein
LENINLDQLELLFKVVLDNLKRSNIRELSFDEDNYWDVPSEDITSFPEKPELEVGSLHDDINFLKSLIEEGYRTDFLELERLAALLKFMSKKLCCS